MRRWPDSFEATLGECAESRQNPADAPLARGEVGYSRELREPSENISRLPVTDVELSGSTVAFTFHSTFGAHRASGGWDRGMILGRIEGGGLTGDFHLLPVRELPGATAASWAGSYTEGGSHHLLVVRRAGGVLAWAATDQLEWHGQNGACVGRPGDRKFSLHGHAYTYLEREDR